MILRKLTLENFGLYGGRQEIDLAPRGAHGEHPIVLIGGRNGAGKTTLLEAIRLALYGRRALGARVGLSEYQKYLARRIHAASEADWAAVGLQFDYAENGEVHTFDVRRQWGAGRGGLDILTLLKGGVEVDAVPSEEWNSFLLDLIPPGLSQLFFFDGEKIQEIAEGDDADGQLAAAVRGLLGVELVTRLRDDLAQYYARQQRAKDATAEEVLTQARAEIAALEGEISALDTDVLQQVSEREGQARAAERIRNNFVAEGGDAARNRARLEADRELNRRRIARATHELREISNGLLPFLMAPKVTSGLRAVLASAADQRTAEAAASVAKAVEGWRETREAREAHWSADHWQDLKAFLDRLAAPAGTPELSSVLAELGDGEAAQRRLALAEKEVRPRALEIERELEETSRTRKRIETELARADNAEGSVALDELLAAERRLGEMEAAVRVRETELTLKRGRLVTLKRDYEKRREAQSTAEAATNRAALAATVSKVLGTYEKRLLELKLGQLSEAFATCFNLLARKDDLVSGVRIDPEQFTPVLLDRDGRELPKAALSAGEKQVFAIAMLWALAQTSGRPLPMVIDTPLARLDTEHRANLAERYFPNASHQVVLLSTDTEVDDALRTTLGENVSHAYRLDYLAGEGRTSVVEGYFEIVEGGDALQQA